MDTSKPSPLFADPPLEQQDPGAGTTSTAQVLRRLRVVFNAVRSHFQQIEAQLGLGGAQVWALSVVRDNPAIGIGGLAKSMDIHQSTASNLVKTLLRRALISMTRSPDDRRNVHLHILPAGLLVLRQASGPFEGALPMALGKLRPETLQRMDRDLGELIQLLKSDEKAGSIPLTEH